MPKVCMRFLLAAAFWLATMAATAQPTEQILSAPLDSTQIPEQNVLSGTGVASASPAAADRALGGLCSVEKKSDTIAAACEAATLDLIQSFAASTLAANEATRRATDSRIDFDTQARVHTLAALEAQAARSEMLFWTAMITVALGLIAAALQFWRAWKSEHNSAPTEIAISEKQISIKTAWIGVVLLAMSMGFLTLYLTLVYPIEPI